MRALWFVALSVVLCMSYSSGQQADPSAPLVKKDAQPVRVKVYSVGPGVTAPELFPPYLVPISDEQCKMKVDGKVVLSVLVDTTGQPRNIMFLRPLGTKLDQMALNLVAVDRFKPGTHDGAPVVVGQSVEVDLQSCVDEKKDNAGKKTYSLRLRSQPVQNFSALPQPLEEAILAPIGLSLEDTYKDALPYYRVGGKVSAPVVLYSPNAEFSDDARRAKYSGVCIISMIVDADGMPQNLRIVKPLDHGLSEKAIEAVSRYRFKPAMKDGKPVPVMVNVEVNFRLR
jgi:TonB family protein